MSADEPEPERAPIGDDHDWIGGAVGLAVDEVRRYLGTLARFCAAPRRFGAAWAANGADALNPLGFLATSAAMLGLVVHVGRALVGGGDDTIGDELLQSLRPYLLFALFGVLGHFLLRRKRLRSSVAMALYAGAGPATLSTGVLLTILFALRLAFHIPFDQPLTLPHTTAWTRLAIYVLLFWPLVWFWTSLSAALAGLHGLPRWRAALAVALAQLLLAIATGLLVARHLETPGGVFLPSIFLRFTRGLHGLPVPHFGVWY